MEDWFAKDEEQREERGNSVHDILVYADDLDLDEVLVIGRNKDGAYYLDSMDDAFGMIGHMESYKADLINKTVDTIDLDE